MKALAREKSSRYANLDELARALQPYLSATSHQSSSSIEITKTRSTRSRLRNAASLMAILAELGGSLGSRYDTASRRT